MHSRRISFFFDDDHLTRMKALKERENKKWRREKKDTVRIATLVGSKKKERESIKRGRSL